MDRTETCPADLAVKGVPRNWHAASMGELVLSLNAAAEEGESRIAGYQYKPGYLENGVWKAIESEEIATIDIQDLSQGIGEITYPSNAVRNTLSGKILAYRVEATNTVELASWPGYTNGIKIYEEIPQVRTLRGSIQNGGLVFTWDIENAEALNLPEGTLTLTGPDNLARTDSIPSHRRWIRYEGLEEGHYILTISFTDESGPVPASVSKSVTFDITGPEIRSVDHQKYADSRLTFRVVAQDKDNLSGVGHFQYQLTFPDMQNNEWMERNVDGDMLDESLFLRELTDGDSIFLSLIALTVWGTHPRPI